MRQSSVITWLAIAGMLVTVVATAQDKPAASGSAVPPEPTLVTPKGEYKAAWLSLDGAGQPCSVYVAWRDGKPVQFWSTSVTLPGVRGAQGTLKLLTDSLRGDAAKVDVELRLVSVWAPIRRMALQTLALDLSSSTWTLTSDGKEAGKGTLAKSAAANDPIAAGQDWPSFWGTMAACAGPAYGKPMVDDLAQARPSWRSEAVALNAWGTGADGRYKERAAVGTLCGGASSPVAADGLVYLYSYVPSGDVVPEGEAAATVEKFKEHPVESDHMRRWFSTRADVVVTAMDGATGKTVWQSVWPRKQGNWQTHKWRGANPTPAVGKGVLVVADYSWGLHAYDAKTGALKWSRGGGGAIGKDNGHVGPTIAGDVAVWATGNGTVGLDLQTGKELWKAPGGQSARRMTMGGQERVLIVGGTSSLVDPAAGKVFWSSGEVASNRFGLVAMPVCDGDKAVFYGAKYDPQTGRPVDAQAGTVVAYTVSDGGMVKAWESDPVTWDENMVMAIARGRVFVAAREQGLLALDLGTGKVAASNPVLKCGSNAGIVVVDDRVFYQPEGQHGSQRIHQVDASTLKELGGPFVPRHNDATAYGQMALSNVVVDGRLIVRGMDGVYCYDLRRSAGN